MNTKNGVGEEAGNDLTDIQKDALREVGNIGAAHAATALSKMLNETIMIDVTSSHIIEIEDIQNHFGNSSDLVAGIYMQVYGNGTHNLLMLFPHENAINLVDMFFKRPVGTTKEFTPKDDSALTEIGNVCACAYLNALSSLLDITLFPTPPGLAKDMIGAVLEFPLLEIGARLDYIVIIQTELIQNSHRFNGYFLFMPDIEVQKAIMDKFKIDFKRSDG